MREAFFIAFGVFSILCSIAVVISRNAVYSAFSLILCFFGLSALYVLWGATFIAMIQILIYTGAIVVLFVFVVMLLNLGRGSGPMTVGWVTGLISGAAAWFFSLLLLRTLNRASLGSTVEALRLPPMREVSSLLFNEYLWPFEVLSVFLLALIVAIYCLTRPETEDEMEGTV